MEYAIGFIFRYVHVLAGITWIGMLYYFNFVQTEYFKEAEAEAKKDAMAKLAPRALWWFRWGAMFTFITGLYLFHKLGAFTNFNQAAIWVGATAGTFMFLNVWLIIWPNQQVVLGMKEGDGPLSAAKAGLASRTNTLFSGPMLLGMLGSKHPSPVLGGTSTGLMIALGLIILLEINAIMGKQGPMTTVKGVIHMSLLLTVAICGRTPRINKNGGRDHWGRIAPLMIYGGGVTHGQVIGQSSKDGGEPITSPWKNENLVATILHNLFDIGELRLESGLPVDLLRFATTGTPISGLTS